MISRLFAIASLVVLCASSSCTSPQVERPTTGEPTDPTEQTASTAPGEDWRRITLVSYTCGDNCYLDYEDPNAPGEVAHAICLAANCGEWERAGALPVADRGRVIEANFGTTEQRDNAGTVMDANYTAVLEIRAADY